MDVAVWVVAFYGLVSLVGGAIGYLKAKSVASLVAGSLAGTLLVACAFGLRHDNQVAAIGSLIIAVLLGGRFFGTWRRTHRLMPDLIMILFSAATLITVGAGLLHR